MSELAEFEKLSKRRRTNLRVDSERPVDRELLSELIQTATLAPNHHRTWPWRFAVLDGDSRAQLGVLASDALAASGNNDEARLAKTRNKYLRSPVVIVIGCQSTERPESQNEDFDAVAAATQNLLLAATAAGLASYWASPAIGCNSAPVRSLCGFSEDTEIRAFIYLGWAHSEAPAVQRPEAQITWVD